MTQTVLKTLVAVVAVFAAWQAGRARPPAVADPDTPTPAARPVPVGGQLRGMAIQLHGGPDVFEHYHRLIPEVAGLGADTVLFVVHGWQEHAGSNDLRIDGRRTADAEQLGRLCDLAAVHGLRVILMPIVLLTNPRNSEWRGQIVPANRDWDAWFQRYTEFIVHFAKIAEQHHVAVLMIGSELIKTERYPERWRAVIAEVRRHYRGKLGYSANWDHYQTDKIAFWPELDYVGMTTYYDLADKPGPTVAQVMEKWRPIKEEILKFQRVVNKPILFTEVGWCSQEGAASEAWNYYHNQKATEAGHREQYVCYEAFIKTWSDVPAVGGIIWWEWDNNRGGKDDHNYTPRGKLAETLLRMWFAKKPGLASDGTPATETGAAPTGQP